MESEQSKQSKQKQFKTSSFFFLQKKPPAVSKHKQGGGAVCNVWLFKKEGLCGCVHKKNKKSVWNEKGGRPSMKRDDSIQDITSSMRSGCSAQSTIWAALCAAVVMSFTNEDLLIRCCGIKVQRQSQRSTQIISLNHQRHDTLTNPWPQLHFARGDFWEIFSWQMCVRPLREVSHVSGCHAAFGAQNMAFSGFLDQITGQFFCFFLRTLINPSIFSHLILTNTWERREWQKTRGGHTQSQRDLGSHLWLTFFRKPCRSLSDHRL